MGRVYLVILVIVAIYLVWRAFGPSTWQRIRPAEPIIKGPDDDPDFLWELEKRQFKERRAREMAEEKRREQEERERRLRKRREDGAGEQS